MAAASAARSSRSTLRRARCCGCTARTKGTALNSRRAFPPAAACWYWTDGREERILYVTTGYRLKALNAKTGALIPGFGKNGVVDLKEGLRSGSEPVRRSRRRRADDGGYRAACVARHRQGHDVVGAAGREGTTPCRAGQVKGYVRAFDVKHRQAAVDVPHDSAAGRVWLRHVAERLVGGNGAQRACGRRWPIDEELGHGRICRSRRRPTTTTAVGRPGNNLFAESLVALDLKTGQRKWHFQVVHHPLWDFDLSSAPILADITVNGRADQGRGAAQQAVVPVRLRSRDRPAGLADRGASGAEGRRAGRVVLADAAVFRPSRRRTRGRSSRQRPHRLHAGTAREGGRRLARRFKLAKLFDPPIAEQAGRAATSCS